MSLWWLNWCGYYDFAKYLGVKFDEEVFTLFMDFQKEIHFIIPYKKIVFISEKPIAIHWKDKLLHHEKGPAIEYKDGYVVWSLNGVRVTKELVKTPANKLDPKLLLKEKNAEIRREIVRKIGIERICQKLKTKTLDLLPEQIFNGLKTDYELLQLEIPEMNRPATYLKMLNPSIGTYHLEGVPPDIETCQQAIIGEPIKIKINYGILIN